MKNVRSYSVLAISLVFASCTSIQSSLCHMKDGEPYINLGGYQYCGEKYKDGGKECYSSSECQGKCVLPVDWNPEEEKEVVGRCRSDSTWYLGHGCLAIEDYKHRSSCIEE